VSESACLKCNSEYFYQDQGLLICPECAYESNPSHEAVDVEALNVKHANGHC
jgi:protein PhnA